MKYKERVIRHNIDIPELRTVGYSDMTEIYYDPSVVSHHPRSFEYYFTHGIVVNEKRYIIKEFFVRESKLYAVITEDEDKYYEIYLSFMEEDTIERIKKGIEEFEKQLSKLNVPKPNQTLSLSNNILSISDGNSVELPQSSDQVLSLENHTLKISKGNTVELPNDHQTISKVDNKIVLSNNGGEVELPQSITPYDDTSVKSRLNALETKQDKDTKYTAKGNGLILNSDNSFQLDIATNIVAYCPYKTNGSRNITLTSELRYYNHLENSLSYAVDNDGTEYKGTVTEAGVLFNFEGHSEYEGNTIYNLSGNNFILNSVATNSTTVNELSSTYISNNVKFDVELDANWKDSNNKVSFSIKPKLIWEVKLESHTEYYVHNLTKEEFDSSEPIEIEVKRGESVIGRLNLTFKNVRVYLQSHQDRIVLKNPTDNKYYYVPRLG